MISNIKCLIQACTKLQINFKFIDKNQNVVKVDLSNDKSVYFTNSTTPFNSESVAHICKDKDFSYQILKDVIRLPRTLSFLDPNVKEKYKEYLRLSSFDSIIKQVKTELGLPVILKKNSGSLGINVFKCETEDLIQQALSTIFDKNSSHYDYIALAQEYIKIKKEYRVIVFNKQVVLVYLKDNSNGKMTDNLSPLHWQDAQAELITNTKCIQKLQEFIHPIFKELDLNFGGLDIAEDEQGNLVLIELNSRPMFDFFVKDNGEKKLVEMYEKILSTTVIAK